MEAGKRTIAEIFNRGRSLEIPFFQRGYVWEEENWQRFLDDMSNLKIITRDYFLGSLILKSQARNTAEPVGDCRIVVDGQQRLTTLLLFINVLTKIKHEPRLMRDTFYNYYDQFILKHNHNDAMVFNSIIEDQLTDQIRSDYAENLVLKCHDFFAAKQDIIREIDFFDVLTKIYFVGIDLGENEDEQQIFDTINSLGVSLTTAELLKNELYRRTDLDLFESTWKQVFEKDQETRQYWDKQVTSGRERRANIDLLLQAYLLICTRAHDSYVRLEGLFYNYKRYLAEDCVDKQEFVEIMTKYAEVYRQNINPSILEEDIPSDSAMSRLNVLLLGLNTTTVIPYILYLLMEAPTIIERDSMFRLLESYLVRRVICKETTKNYNNLFASLIRKQINSFEKLSATLYKAEDPTNRMPTDEVLQMGFRNSNLTNQQARVVLYLIEKSIRNNRIASVSPLGLNRYTLEHVMPKKWQNNWGVVSDPLAKTLRDQKILKLGNLTLITSSLNSSIRDADWETKKDKGLNKFGRGLMIFDDYLESPIWTEETIDGRTDWLFSQAKSIWKFNPLIQ